MAKSVVFVSLVSVLGLVLCFASYSIKRKIYLYVRNALFGAFGSLFLLTMLLATDASLQGCGFTAMLLAIKKTTAWWQLLLKLLVPLVVALTTIFLAELPQKFYEVCSAFLISIPLTCGLYVTPEVSQGVFTALIVVYSLAMIVVGLLMFRTYLCVECAAVGGFMTAKALQGFYALSSVTMFILTGVLTLLGAGVCIFMAANKDKKNSPKVDDALKKSSDDAQIGDDINE